MYLSSTNVLNRDREALNEEREAASQDWNHRGTFVVKKCLFQECGILRLAACQSSLDNFDAWVSSEAIDVDGSCWHTEDTF